MNVFVLAALFLSQEAPSAYHVKAALSSAQAKAGEPVKLDVKFDVVPNAHISDEAPLWIKLSGDGVSFEKPVLHYGDAQKPTGAAPSFSELVKPSGAGQHVIDVQMSFYVCTAELCNHVTEHQTLTLAVK